ncbi:MAG: ABC transporter ATP-binding protein [Deltaproteobacteria bacterium]|nr:ABC transporter ATP-binding protein [Deltaproteobacteria bacterium]
MPDLAIRDLTKTFRGTLAVDHVSIDFPAGEIHAILGENGAGKSTLMHLVSGLYRPDLGTILIDGHPHRFSSPRSALAAGIAMVHQHFMLIPSFTIAENILLAHAGSSLDRIDRKVLSQQIVTLATHFGINIENPDTPIAALSVGSQQRVEILKALAASARILILDEPTAVLTPAEVENLFAVLRRLKQERYLILLITHKIPEVVAIADRLSVLRRGRLVTTKNTATTTPAELAQLMVGELPLPSASLNLTSSTSRDHPPHTSPHLSLDSTSFSTSSRGVSLHNLSLDVRPGEIVGIAGVAGNGQTELIEILLGLQQPTQGTITISGNQLRRSSPAQMRTLGIALIPQDRRQEGLALSLSVEDNLLLNSQRLATVSPGPFLSPSDLRHFAITQIDRFGIRTSSPFAATSSLSGGNQQRIVIARELATQPQLIIAANPTRGLDIGATDYVHRTLNEHCQRGAGVLLFSTDLDEILALSHRIYALYHGRLLGPVDPQIEPAILGQMMTGVTTAS